MARSKSVVISWLPVLACMVLIFGASTDLLSSRHTSRFIGPILRWFRPGASDEAVRNVQIAVRKCGHVTEYAVLAWLLYRALRRSWERRPDVWCPLCAKWAFSIALAYAASDEWHQSFVPSRGSSIHDVLIDGGGAALGLLLLHGSHLWRQARELRRSD